MSDTMLKDCIKVASIINKISSRISSYVNNLELATQEEYLMTFMEEAGERAFSCEAACDPENLARRRDRISNNLGKLKQISDFKSDLLKGNYDTRLNLPEHPWYFKVLGEYYYSSEDTLFLEGSSFYDLHPVALEMLLNYIQSIDKFITLVSGQEYPEEELEAKCENCCGECGTNNVSEEPPFLVVKVPEDKISSVLDCLKNSGISLSI